MLKKEIHREWANCIHQILKREEKIIQKLEAGIDKQDIIQQGVFYSDKKKIQEPMRSFLEMWDTAMYNHHEALIKEGGLIKFSPNKGILF